jgi:glutamate dehydrogenase (NAD(P)+)
MNEDVFRFSDNLGPTRIIHVYEPVLDLKGILVVDNVAAGPSIGGLRMAPDVSLEECVRLARAMTLKNAAAELPHGGGKSILFGDPAMDSSRKEQLIRGFCAALGNEEDYIFGPDMGTNEQCMAWVKDEIGRSVGLPREIGGIPLDEIGATGWGVAHAAEVAAGYCDLELDNARVVIQGFGAVGSHAARFLADKGTQLVGASDSRGSVYDADGLDVEELAELKREGASILDYPGGQKSVPEAVIGMECDIWVPAARPDILNRKNIADLKTRVVVQGANIPATIAAEKYMKEHGIVSVPDFIANAGGVICAAMEYQGSTESAVFSNIENKVRRNTQLVLDAAFSRNMVPRQAAVELAEERVIRAMSYRRWNVF